MTTVLNPTSWLGKALDLDIYGKLKGKKGQRTEEFLKMILLECAEGTHLPELCEALGPDIVLKLFDCFAGTTIKIPNRDAITKSIRDATIFFTVHKAKVGSKAEIARDMAGAFELSADSILGTYVKMKKKYEAYQEATCQQKK